MNAAAKPSQNVSRETSALLSAYVDHLLKWNTKINLIGPATEQDVWSRHIDDALQLVPLIPTDATSLIDLGTGAGIPGLVIAMARPELSVTLVEIDQRKSAFLREARRALALDNVTVKAEDLYGIGGQYDVVTARALAPLSELVRMAYPLLAPGAICLFPKGQNFAKELEALAGEWHFKHRLNSRVTNEKSSIISISELVYSRAGNP